jgi:predicted metal-dependent hydrolase
MICEQYSVEYGAVSIDYTVARRKRETLEIAVEPDSKVSVVAPISASTECIRKKVRKRAPWILKQQKYFDQFKPRTPGKRYLSGETHLYLGRQYRLKVVQSELPSVKLLRGRIIVGNPVPTDRAETKRLLDEWYETKARTKLPERIDACLGLFSRPALVTPSGFGIRKLQKRWGSMSKTKRLLLNVRLIQASVDAIDYVITHELCHIAEPNHGPKFYRLMHRAMQDWKKRKEKLERLLA